MMLKVRKKLSFLQVLTRKTLFCHKRGEPLGQVRETQSQGPLLGQEGLVAGRYLGDITENCELLLN